MKINVLIYFKQSKRTNVIIYKRNWCTASKAMDFFYPTRKRGVLNKIQKASKECESNFFIISS